MDVALCDIFLAVMGFRWLFETLLNFCEVFIFLNLNIFKFLLAVKIHKKNYLIKKLFPALPLKFHRFRALKIETQKNIDHFKTKNKQI